MQFNQKTYRKSPYIHSSKLPMQSYPTYCHAQKQSTKQAALTPNFPTPPASAPQPPYPLYKTLFSSSSSSSLFPLPQKCRAVQPPTPLPSRNLPGRSQPHCRHHHHDHRCDLVLALSSYPPSKFSPPLLPPRLIVRWCFSAADGFVALWLSGFFCYGRGLVCVREVPYVLLTHQCVGTYPRF